MPASFIYNRQRDAFRAIRGFYYQIELTVVRWLQLTGDAILMCECGEDIDHVSRLADAGIDADTQRRILEQVKLRKRITLRSPEALSALARFREGTVRNPEIQILYRFATTATVGREQGVIFPKQLTGIAAWEALRQGELTPEETVVFLEALRALVAECPCPSDLDRRAFLQLQNYVRESDAPAIVDELVRPFEWATGLPEPPKLLAQVHGLLLEQQRANVREEAEHLADVLVVHVFRLLTATGEKRLTAEALDRLLLERSLTEVDRRLLTRLTTVVEQSQAYLAQMSPQVGAIFQRVAALQGVPQQLNQLAAGIANVQAHIAPPALPPPDEPPLVGAALTRRRGFIQRIAELLRGTVWLSIEGATGMGKTYAGKLLADEVGPANAAWISLRGERLPVGIHRHVELHLLRLGQDQALVSRYFAGDLPFSELAAHAVRGLNVLVIDEVPDLLREPALMDQLLVLTGALSESGGKLVTTTTREIPQRVIDHLGERIQRLVVPPLDADDIEEILAGAGAPAGLRTRSYLDVIRAVTHGHPSLVSAVIAFLRRKSWRIGLQELTGLLTGDVARDVRTETVRKVASLLASDEARELLYRLSLIGGDFGRDLLFDVARVAPSVPRAGEHLTELIGPWVNRLPGDRMEVSPLLSLAGHETLGPELRRGVHLAIAHHYARRPEVDDVVARQIILHAAAGEDWHLLVGFIVRLAVHIQKRAQAEAFQLLTLLFSAAWPSDMPPAFRIMFRAVQVRLLMLLGEDETAFAEDLDRLISEAQRQALPSVLTALFLVGPMNPAARPGPLARRVLQARRILPSLPSGFRGLTGNVPIESSIWLGVTRVQNLADVRELLGVLQDMTPDERAAAFAYAPLADAPQMLVDRCWMLELGKDEEARDWGAVLRALDEIRQTGEMPGGGELLAPEVRARAVVLDALGRPEEALEVIERHLVNADADGRFLLDYTAGCVLLDISTPEQALGRFRRALASGTARHALLRCDAARLAVEAAGRNGEWLEACEGVKACLRIMKSEGLESLLEYERLEAIGELAWARWSSGDRRRACGAMAAVVRALVRAPDFAKARFHEVFLKTGHALGWMAAIAKHHEPPPHGADGSPYIEPFPGFFSRPRPGLTSFPVRGGPHVLGGQLGMLATGAGLIGVARKSLLAARQTAESAGISAFCHVIDVELAEVATLAGDYPEAMRRGVSGVRAFAARRHGGGGIDLLGRTGSLDEVWSGLNQAERHEIERHLFWIVVGPAVTRALADRGAAEVGPLADTLERVVGEVSGELSEVAYWAGILRELRVAFSPLATRETIRGQLSAHSEDLGMSVLLYLAVSEAPNSSLRESCGAQAVAVDGLLRMLPASQPMASHVARYIINFWRRAVEGQAFALWRPHAFRTHLASVQGGSLSDAAQVLLGAAGATGVNLAQALARRLAEAATPDVGRQT